jgi:hypothetical protein
MTKFEQRHLNVVSPGVGAVSDPVLIKRLFFVEAAEYERPKVQRPTSSEEERNRKEVHGT